MSVARCAKVPFSRTSRNVAGTVVIADPLSPGLASRAYRRPQTAQSLRRSHAARSIANGCLLDGRHEVAFEPGTREERHRIERAGLFEEVRSPPDDHELLLAAERCERRPVQLDHHGVISTDDEQRGSPDT